MRNAGFIRFIRSVVELADTSGLSPDAVRRAGSTPAGATTLQISQEI